MAGVISVSATGNQDIDGLLGGTAWSGVVTYSFPDSPADYSANYGYGETTDPYFSAIPAALQAVVTYAVSLVMSYTNLVVQFAGTDGADIAVAQTSVVNPTSWAYLPDPAYAEGGDAWFGTAYDFSQAAPGNYYFADALHELGHSFGLKHSQDGGGVANVAVPTVHDNLEYTVMSYRSYAGADVTGSYTNEDYGYTQTYMANDILALQAMYGANFTTQSGNTVYTWNPTTGQEFINGVGQPAPGDGTGGTANRIFETIWDGGGVDTYDLSNYTTDLKINLNPGASSVLSTDQLAYLGDGHYASGNVYNAYLYNGDARSYIDNAVGGSGNDTIIGNAIANVLNGGNGNDTITGGGGNDTIIGGPGTDTAVYSGNRANYAVLYNSAAQTFTITDLRAGSPDGTDTVSAVEYFQFADQTVASAGFAPVVLESVGISALVLNGNNYSLNPTAGGTGPTLKNGGAAVVAGNYGAWSPYAAEQVTGGGYDVAWKNSTTGYFSIWSTDSNGNYASALTPEVPGTDSRLIALETAFHQDLNGDGTIGASAVTVEGQGTTSLVLSAGNYYLNPTAGGIGPTLKNGGAAVVAGNYGAWSPYAAEQVTGGGYDVAWKNSTTGYFSIWSTDSNGNYASALTPEVPGTDSRLIALETAFHQDLNGDGTIGASAVTVEGQGTTSLVLSAGNYYLNPTAGGTGPTLKNGGAAVVAGNYGAWSPYAAEQVTGGGYDVAWKNSTTGYFSIWSTDSNGNYASALTPEVPGTDSRLIALETAFHQDLNGDGTIGASAVTVEGHGTTSLVLSAGNYYLNPTAGGTGPTLKNGGAAVVAGNYGTWSPYAAEQVTGGGYDVAWKNSTTGYFSIWSTDSNGNYASALTPEVPGTDSRLKALESTFKQDLNGDGVVSGAPPANAGAAFVFNANQVGTTLSNPSELPASPTAAADGHAALVQAAGEPVGGQNAIDNLLTDVLHYLHDHGFMLG